MFAQIARTQVLQYDRAHRLTGVVNLETYTYDAHGQRIATTRFADGLKRYQVYSKAGQLVFTQGHRSNQIVDYISLDGNLVAQRAQPIAGGSQTITYLHTDMRGTPVVETNAAGTPTQPRTLLAPSTPLS
jgi:YD repeat-containing protein